MGTLIRAALLATLTASPVRACPVCDSEVGREVQAGVFGDDFLLTAATVLLPVAIMAGIAALIPYAFPKPRGDEGG